MKGTGTMPRTKTKNATLPVTKAIKQAMKDAGKIMRRWYRAAKDGGHKQITRAERKQLQREIALGLLQREGIDTLTTADLP